MTNPPPRPALRKAPDADVHPVAPVPAPAAPARPELRPVVGIGGRTSDTLVARTPKKSKRTTLEVKVPKALVKSVKREVKVRGDSLDDIVSAALQTYLDRA
jgi:hypothetical protein